jgi:hypothetical protein
MRLGSMSLGIFAPRGTDRQTPEQDELYIVAAGTAPFEHAGVFSRVAGSDALFVAAGDDHRFRDMGTDFVSWVIFWGPKAGESDHG